MRRLLARLRAWWRGTTPIATPSISVSSTFTGTIGSTESPYTITTLRMYGGTVATGGAINGWSVIPTGCPLNIPLLARYAALARQEPTR